MRTNNSKDAPGVAKIPFVLVPDPNTGLMCQILKPAYEHALRTGGEIVIRIDPNAYEASRAESDPAPMTETDEIIAEIIDLNPGCVKDDIYRLAESRYSTPLGTDGLKNRMRKGYPLPSRGYHVKQNRYFPPTV